MNAKHLSTAPSQVTVGTRYTYLSEAVVEFSQDVTLVKHLAVEAMFIVVGNALSQVTRQLAVRHVLLDLLELRKTRIHSTLALVLSMSTTLSAVG